VAGGLIGCVTVAVLFVALPVVIVRMSGYAEKAGDAKIRADLQALLHGAEFFKAASTRYPRSFDELATFLKENGIPELAELRDPWGNGYTYRILDGRLQVACLGRDGREGGEGPNRDFFIDSPGAR